MKSKEIGLSLVWENNLSAADLPRINAVIEASVQSWPTTTRLKRLAMAPLQYRALDLQDFEFLLCYKAHACLGIAVWQPSCPLRLEHVSGDLDGAAGGEASAVLLHGLFVSAKAQGRGIGGMLLDELTRRANREKFAGLFVRAERFSTSFFEHQGFSLLTHEEEQGFQPMSYPHRYVLDLSRSEGSHRDAPEISAYKISG
jgi:GNAT superfamily N-acetyltransferase